MQVATIRAAQANASMFERMLMTHSGCFISGFGRIQYAPDGSLLGRTFCVLSDLEAGEQFDIAPETCGHTLQLRAAPLAFRCKLRPLGHESLAGLLLIGQTGCC